MKSFRPKEGADEPPGGGRNGSRNFHGEERRNDTHALTTDPAARLFRKGRGKEAKLSFMGHLLRENRSGLVVGTRLTRATGGAERAAALAPTEAVPGRHRITLAADRAYDTASFVAGLRALNATPPRRPEQRRPRLAPRPPHRSSSRLSREPAGAQANRGGVRLGQDHRAAGQNQVPRHRTGRLGLHPRGGGVQPDPPAQAAAQRAMNPSSQLPRRRDRPQPSTPSPPASSKSLWRTPSVSSATSSDRVMGLPLGGERLTPRR
jgi:hypothetical protein